MIGMFTSLTQDVPPYVILNGNPAATHGINTEGLKRRGFSKEAIQSLRQAYKVLYKSGLTLEEAKTALQSEEDSQPEHAAHIRLLREFLEISSRGIVR